MIPKLRPVLFLILLLFALTTYSVFPLAAQQPASNRLLQLNKNRGPLQQAPMMDSLFLLQTNRSIQDRLSMGGAILKAASSQKAKAQKSVQTSVKIKKNSSLLKPYYAPTALGSVCYTESGRNFLYQDSLVLYTGDPALTADGNVIISGQFIDYAQTPSASGGFCMKTDPEGNVIWAKLYDSANRKNRDYLNLFRALELKSGAILLTGRTTNKVTGNDDFVLMKLNKDGNLIWSKTYQSRFWQGFNGSGDMFALRDLEEDPITGELYFVGYHWGGISAVTKVDPSDGHVLWSNGYETGDVDHSFGIVINQDKLSLFQQDYNYSYSNIYATAIDKTTGDTLYTKRISQYLGGYEVPRMSGAFEVLKLNNGHFLLSAPTTGWYGWPIYTGTKDLYHAMVVELDESLNFVKAYIFKNRFESNYYNTKVSLFPDGSGVFTMYDIIGSYTGDAYISIFKNGQIYHQRKRLHRNEGIPYEPPTLQLSNGGYLNIKLMGDSTRKGVDGSKIDFHLIHSSDTPSVCLGVTDSSTTLQYIYFEPNPNRLKKVNKNVFSESRVVTFDTWDYETSQSPACQVISHCDSLALQPSATKICPGSSITLTIQKNRECGSWVPLIYDTTWVTSVTCINDTTYNFLFDKSGSGYIHASLMGCVMHDDSVLIEVMEARYALELGPDTVICPGNRIVLNARKGFASYRWNDGSTDSTLTASQPGIYYFQAINSCGMSYYDTIVVRDHPPVPINIGPDRVKCNNDTIRLIAPDGFLNYFWSNNYNISSLGTQEVIVNPLVDTAYYIKAEKTPGCFAYDTIRVQVNRSPAINLGPDLSFCKGQSKILDAGAGFHSYLWNGSHTAQQINVYAKSTYTVIGTTIEGCRSYDTLQVTNVFDNPVVQLNQNDKLCTGEQRTLDAGSFSSYLWQDGSARRTFSVTKTGTYYVQVTDPYGCKGSDTTRITTMLPLPARFLPADTAICSYGALQLKSSQAYKQYSWSTGQVTAALAINKAGLYWVEVVDENNCRGRDSVLVRPKECMQGLYVPSAFTPNSDQTNDVFRAWLFGNVKAFQFTIYNRWGEVVFYSTDREKGWDGNFKGKRSDSGVFVWMCTYQLEGQDKKQEKGTVTLIR